MMYIIFLTASMISPHPVIYLVLGAAKRIPWFSVELYILTYVNKYATCRYLSA